MATVPHLDGAMNGRRVFVLDTNVLLYDPNALGVFEEHNLVIPITVIEEIDLFKKDLNETGRNAREVSRRLDALRERGSLSKGVPMSGGGVLRVEMPSVKFNLPEGFGPRSNDNLILATVLGLAQRRSKGEVVFVTRDTNMRIKADALGITVNDYEHAHLDIDEQYTGVSTIEVPSSMIADSYSRGWIPADEIEVEGRFPNQFFVLRGDDQPNTTAMVRYDANKDRYRQVGRFKEGIWGIFARNKEQLFAMDLLMDDSLALVTLNGKAGTGKTLLAIACGLNRVLDEQQFSRMVVSRPIFPLGRDIGFLPGDLSEKLNPWMKPIFDNLELLCGESDSPNRNRNQAPNYQTLLDQGMIEVEPLTYIRGRSLPRQFLVVDEAQNLTPHEVKTVITRAGEGTKVILTGDPYQIDNPYVDALSNGLTYVVERFKNSPIAGHAMLMKGERSELAEAAANLL